MKKVSFLLFLVLVVCSCSNKYYVKSYKTENEIESGNQADLRSRFSTFEFKDVNLHFEWYTYDNLIINRSPYKFFIVSEPKSDNFERVEIESINIKSSQGRGYSLQVKSWPVILHNEAMKRDSHTFEPAFKFRFGKKEQIETIIIMKIIGKDGVETKELNLRWKPVKVKHYAPIR